MRRSELAVSLSLALGLGACASSPAPSRSAAPAAATAASSGHSALAHLEERALLLLLIDQQAYDPFTVEHALAGPPALREHLAEALGRIGDPEGVRPLEALLFDAEAPVRRAAAFALGELDGPAAKHAARSLLTAAVDGDRETGALAVEALGKLGVAVLEVGEALTALPEEERWPRLVPSLFRFREEAMLPLAEAALESADPELHSRAAYALARDPFPAAAPRLRELLADPDPWVRAVAARGVGILEQVEDLPRLRALLDDPASGPAIQALRAARRIVAGGKAAPPADWIARLGALLDDPRVGVRLTALEVVGTWADDPGLRERLAALANPPAVAASAAEATGRRQRELAMLALAEGGAPQAVEAIAAAAGAPLPPLRARAAEAAGRGAGRLPSHAAALLGLLAGLADDPDPGVRAAALAARLDAGAEAAGVELARAALADPDPIVRAAALDWLEEHPRLEVEALAAAALSSGSDRLNDAALAAARALAARGKDAALERGAAVAALETLAADPRFLVRRAAASSLVALERPAPAVGRAETGRSSAVYHDILLRTARPQVVELATSRGPLRLRLDCPQAPLTCLSFLQLGEQGFFDGLAFHRVVPDFVVQGGDPRGDGSGGPGYEIRDEINRRRYRRGTLGMALAGADTGGSQFFVTISPQPHLDGGYTAFGEVIGGEEVLDALVQGDRIEGFRELEAEAAPR